MQRQLSFAAPWNRLRDTLTLIRPAASMQDKAGRAVWPSMADDEDRLSVKPNGRHRSHRTDLIVNSILEIGTSRSVHSHLLGISHTSSTQSQPQLHAKLALHSSRRHESVYIYFFPVSSFRLTIRFKTTLSSVESLSSAKKAVRRPWNRTLLLSAVP